MTYASKDTVRTTLTRYLRRSTSSPKFKERSEFYATRNSMRNYNSNELEWLSLTPSYLIYITSRIEYWKISFRGAPIVQIIRNSTYVKCVHTMNASRLKADIRDKTGQLSSIWLEDVSNSWKIERAQILLLISERRVHIYLKLSRWSIDFTIEQVSNTWPGYRNDGSMRTSLSLPFSLTDLFHLNSVDLGVDTLKASFSLPSRHRSVGSGCKEDLDLIVRKTKTLRALTLSIAIWVKPTATLNRLRSRSTLTLTLFR